MKKGDKNRGEVLLKKLLPSTKFQQGVKNIRRTFDIPLTGYIDKQGIGNWYSERHDITREETPAMADFKDGIRQFLTDQALPAGTWWEHKIIEYVLSNGILEFLWLPPGVEPFVEVINRPTPTKQGSYIDLRVYEGATQRDVKDFIAHHWRTTKPSYRKGTHKQIRKERDFFVNEKAIAIYDLPKEERQKAAGTNDLMKTTKEVEVGRILKGMGIRKTGDAAKATKYRRKNAKR